MRTEQRTRRFRGDDGAAVVEAALAMPIVFFLIMTMIDFTMLELAQSNATSASRDGARKAIVGNWTNADQATYTGGPVCPTGQNNFKKICDAVRLRLAGDDVDSISAKCYAAFTSTVKTCTTSGTNPMTAGIDTIEVTVTYSFEALTAPGQQFLGTSKSFTTKARMVVQ